MTADIPADSITDVQLAPGSVTPDKIFDGTIGDNDIGSDSIGPDKINGFAATLNASNNFSEPLSINTANGRGAFTAIHNGPGGFGVQSQGNGNGVLGNSVVS